MNTAENIKIGDVVMPPERELRLWMRRQIQEKNLPETALHLTVREIYTSSDKGGQWIHVKGQQNEDWCKDHINPTQRYHMTFKARPKTPWTIISKKEIAQEYFSDHVPIISGKFLLTETSNLNK